MQELVEIAKYILSITGIGTFLYFVIKLAISKVMEAGLEKYKAQLNVDLETHKADLSRITQEHRTRFEYFHPERVNAIRDLYDEICVCEDNLIDLTTIAQGPEWVIETEREEKAFNALSSFNNAIRATRLYLDPSLIEKLKELHEFSKEIVFLMRRAKRREASNQRAIKTYIPELEKKLKEPFDNWQEANRRVTEDFEKIKTEVVREFQKLLGGNQ